MHDESRRPTRCCRPAARDGEQAQPEARAAEPGWQAAELAQATPQADEARKERQEEQARSARKGQPPPARAEVPREAIHVSVLATGGLARLVQPESRTIERVEEDLRRALGTKVRLARSRRGGRIVIEYYSDEELGRLYERLTGGTA